MQKYNVGDRGITSKGFTYRVIAVEVTTVWVSAEWDKRRVVAVVVKILDTSSRADGTFNTARSGVEMPLEDIVTYYFWPSDGHSLASGAELKFGKLQSKKLKIKGYANFYPDNDIPGIHRTAESAKTYASSSAIAVAVPIDFDVEV